MQNQMDRTLTILADGESVSGYARARLLGTERLGLYPSLFMLHLWNVAEEDYLLLSRSREITVLHEDVVLVSGSVSDAFRSRGKSGIEVHVAIAPGLALWDAAVSLDVEAGVTVSETVRRLLEASGTGITLLSFPGEDPVTTRRPGVLWPCGGVHRGSVGKGRSQVLPGAFRTLCDSGRRTAGFDGADGRGSDGCTVFQLRRRYGPADRSGWLDARKGCRSAVRRNSEPRTDLGTADKSGYRGRTMAHRTCCGVGAG